MSMTIEDAIAEEAMAAEAAAVALEMLREELVAEFKQERLQSYYLAHPDLHAGATALLSEAHSLFNAGFIAPSLVFAESSAEQTWRSALLRPILFGLVHSESVASLVSGLDVRLDHLPKILFPIIHEIAGVDLHSYSRLGASATLWDEYRKLQRLRNAVLHSGKQVTQEEASTALSVADDLLGEVLGKVLGAIST